MKLYLFESHISILRLKCEDPTELWWHFKFVKKHQAKLRWLMKSMNIPTLDLLEEIVGNKYDFSNKKKQQMVRFINKKHQKTRNLNLPHHLLFLFQPLPSIPSPISIFNIPPRDPSRWNQPPGSRRLERWVLRLHLGFCRNNVIARNRFHQKIVQRKCVSMWWKSKYEKMWWKKYCIRNESNLKRHGALFLVFPPPKNRNKHVPPEQWWLRRGTYRPFGLAPFFGVWHAF